MFSTPDELFNNSMYAAAVLDQRNTTGRKTDSKKQKELEESNKKIKVDIFHLIPD